MRECAYAREPIDFKLLWIRLIRKLWVVGLCILAGMLLFGGGYFIVREVIGERTYQAESVFYVTFAKDSNGEEYDYYNHYTWGTAIGEDALVAQVAALCNESEETIRSAVSATVESDVRYVFVRAVTTSADQSMKIAAALEQAVPVWGEGKPEFESVEISKRATSAPDNSKIRTGSAMVTGAIIGFFFGLLGTIIYLIAADTIFLPASLEKRYGIVTLTAASMKEFAVNCETILKDFTSVICVPGVKDYLPRHKIEFGNRECTLVKNPCFEDSDMTALQTAEAVVVYVPAGRVCGKQVERTLEQFSRMNILVTAMMLVDEKEEILRAYYK